MQGSLYGPAKRQYSSQEKMNKNDDCTGGHCIQYLHAICMHPLKIFSYPEVRTVLNLQRLNMPWTSCAHKQIRGLTTKGASHAPSSSSASCACADERMSQAHLHGQRKEISGFPARYHHYTTQRATKAREDKNWSFLPRRDSHCV